MAWEGEGGEPQEAPTQDAPMTDAAKRLDDVIADIPTMPVRGRVRLRGALDKAEAAPTGRDADDSALGRAIGRRQS
jgi:hypothetical protein